MDDAPPPMTPRGGPDPSRTGRLSRDEALHLLSDADAAMSAGDFADAAMRYGRVVGFDDPAITVAALVGLGEARYRLDDDAAALTAWEHAVQMPETPSTYRAWRNVAAARVRNGDLTGAIDAYKEADRRAPPEDKPEIANRLGWLAKETGNQGAARRYFAKGRGDGPLVSATMVIIAATVIISLSQLLSHQGRILFDTLALDKQAVADGEWWRLFTVTLLHGSLLHLGFNMYALYLVGPIAERWYGSLRFVLFYLACAAAGSIGSFVFGGDVPSVGASGAIFGLFGLLLAAGRIHKPVDRQSRMFVQQLGMLIVLNLVFGFVVPGIDNAAHLAGLAAGLFLGTVVPPTKVRTMASLWQRAEEAGTMHLATASFAVLSVALGVVTIVVVIGLMIGTTARTG